MSPATERGGVDAGTARIGRKYAVANRIFARPPARASRKHDPMKARHRFSIIALFTTVLLLGWGAFVTSIDAGLAVPDWPSSFDSYDPFNPWPGWWSITPVLAEHGHRLLGALVGLMTLILSIWTVASDHRRWMRRLSIAALVLVVLQGFLGGLRVVWVSLDLAVVHACVAQIFFGTLACMTVFTSKSWLEFEGSPSVPVRPLSRLAVLTAVALFIQVFLGALLRHPGTGIDLGLAGLHIFWAFVVVGFVLAAAYRVHTSFQDVTPLRKSRDAMLALLVIQFMLGLTAFFVLLDEAGVTQPSNLQVVANTSHMVVGALLFSSAAVLSAWATRMSVSSSPVSITGDGVSSLAASA